nr:hypothetical protein CFP56_32245 [Quercus suber]
MRILFTCDRSPDPGCFQSRFSAFSHLPSLVSSTLQNPGSPSFECSRCRRSPAVPEVPCSERAQCVEASRGRCDLVITYIQRKINTLSIVERKICVHTRSVRLGVASASCTSTWHCLQVVGKRTVSEISRVVIPYQAYRTRFRLFEKTTPLTRQGQYGRRDLVRWRSNLSIASLTDSGHAVLFCGGARYHNRMACCTVLAEWDTGEFRARRPCSSRIRLSLSPCAAKLRAPGRAQTGTVKAASRARAPASDSGRSVPGLIALHSAVFFDFSPTSLHVSRCTRRVFGIVVESKKSHCAATLAVDVLSGAALTCSGRDSHGGLHFDLCRASATVLGDATRP